VVPRVPGSILKLLTSEFASTFLQGQRVLPKKLPDGGFTFGYPALTDALHQLLPPE
jgi:NAD dependent epimerase/dehydratase family enzyme